jgi:cytochrome d ubiquinol oxidase subunit II
VSEADVVAAILWIAASLYAVLAGADFGAGIWDLLAGDAERGARPRSFMDGILTPVWEANHVWLIFMLVVMWTGFPQAFGSIMQTLFIPLSIAAFGIILRGAGFAFRHMVHGLAGERALGATFAISSLLTPFFLGTVAGAIAGGRVPAEGHGDRLTSWLNLPSIVIGALLVATGAYVAAVYLVTEAHKAGEEELEDYFRRRAIASGVLAGALGAAGLLALRQEARPLFDDLIGGALPLVILSAVCGVAALVQLARHGARTRPLTVGAVVAVVWGWGVAQSPEILPGALTIDQAAAPSATLVALLVVAGVAALVVVPAIALLLVLHQREMLGEAESANDS